MSGAYTADLNFGYNVIYYNMISLVAQMVFYGVYLVLILFSTRMAATKEGTCCSTRILLVATFFPFTLSSLYLLREAIDMKLLIQAIMIEQTPRNICTCAAMFNAVALCNYVVSDAIVVWRMWVLCRFDYKKWLIIPQVLLICTSLSVFVTIGIRIYGTICGSTVSDSGPFARAINTSQTFNHLLSLLTNLTSTSIISHKTWLHRRIIREGLTNVRDGGRPTKAESILLLLIESGFLYCLSSITTITTASVHLPFGTGTVGDLYFPVSVQIAGMYPTVIIVLVGLNRSLNDTTFCHVESAEWKGDCHDMSESQVNHDLVNGESSMERHQSKQSGDSSVHGTQGEHDGWTNAWTSEH